MPKGAALITGASSGIGTELARLCAAGGYGLILVARNADRLGSLAGELAKAHGIQATPLPADLSDPAAPESIFERVRGDTVDILINNAGFGLRGQFAETDWQAQARLLQVNVTALLHLTRLFLPEMIRRRSGRILNVASTAAFVPGPLMAMYYASKAFVRSFSESVADEVRGTGVTMTVLCPGPTRTAFFEAAGIGDSRLSREGAMSAEEVARIGYRAMLEGRSEVIAGARNRWMMRGAPFAPRGLLAKVTRRLNSSA